MRVAERHAAWASIGLVTERIADRASAEAAFVAYGELFAAIRLHVERLMGGPRRIEGMAWSDWINPADRAGLRLVQELARLRPSPERPLVGFGQPTMSWVAAARALGAAGDLLATHTAANGLPRTPDASAWSDGAVRAVGYSHVADLVGTLCSVDRDLALRSGQAGMPWGAVSRPDDQARGAPSAVGLPDGACAAGRGGLAGEQEAHRTVVASGGPVGAPRSAEGQRAEGDRELIEAEATEVIGAGLHERSEATAKPTTTAPSYNTRWDVTPRRGAGLFRRGVSDWTE